MTFESVTRNAQAHQRRVVLADPGSLRECADRLEQSARSARQGESVLCELTPGITVVFRPEARPPVDAIPIDVLHEHEGRECS